VGALQLPTTPAYASKDCRPSAEQLKRLKDLDPYISYFTSIKYGDAEISGDYIRALILTE